MLNFDKYDDGQLVVNKWYRAMAILTEAKKHNIDIFKTLVAGRKLPRLADVDDYFADIKEISKQTGITVYYLRQAARKICDKYSDIISDGYAKWGFEDANEAAEYVECGGSAEDLPEDSDEFSVKISRYVGSKEWKAMEEQRKKYLKESMRCKKKTVTEYYDEPLSNFDYKTFWKIGENGKKDQRIRYLLMQFYRHHITEYVKLIPHGAPKDARELSTMLISRDLEVAIRKLYPMVVRNLEEMT